MISRTGECYPARTEPLMSVAIVLPARLASTRLPNKLLLDRSGKTILEHTIERAQLAQKQYPDLFTTIRVACDDEKLVAAAKRAGVQAVMTRKDHQSGTDRIAEAAADLKEDIIVNLQADEPEIDPEYIGKVAAVLRMPEPIAANAEWIGGAPPGELGMATLATFIYDLGIFNNPNVVKVVRRNWSNRALYFSRAPIPFRRDSGSAPLFKLRDESGSERVVYGFHHIGIYAYWREFLLKFVKLRPSQLEQIEKLEQLRALEYGYGIRVAWVPSHVPGIDTPEDYEAFLERQRNKK